MPKARIFNIMQYERHPETDEILITEHQIISALSHKTIKRWAYVRHDKDVFTAQDEENDSDNKEGTMKPPHWHIVIELPSNAVEVTTVAKWFNIPMQYVNIAKGAGAFMDCVAYLTHEEHKQQAMGKHRYDDKEIKSNFDFREELIKRRERTIKYGKALNDKEYVRNAVLFEGMKLRDVAVKYPLIYQEDFVYLDKCRLKYLSMIAQPKGPRINYYITGEGGMGKGLMSKAIARSLIDVEGNMDDDDIYFEVGSKNVKFDGYDGQPVIIWNDCRAVDLLQSLGGRENVFNVFDPLAPKIKQNIKYGSVLLHNTINIVNSVQPWDEFLDALAGTYTDKYGNEFKAEDPKQSYRRFPFFLVLDAEDFDLGINKGMFKGTREYDEYMTLEHIRGNIGAIMSRCGNNVKLYNAVTRKITQPVIDAHSHVVEQLSHNQQGTDEEILAEFSDVGTTNSEWTTQSVGYRTPESSKAKLFEGYNGGNHGGFVKAPEGKSFVLPSVSGKRITTFVTEDGKTLWFDYVDDDDKSNGV